jgi:hypothetical protein
MAETALAHCETCRCGERFPIQASWHEPRRASGTVSMAEAEAAYAVYAGRYGTQQSLTRLGERGGFSYGEMIDLLGHEPTTWRVRVS